MIHVFSDAIIDDLSSLRCASEPRHGTLARSMRPRHACLCRLVYCALRDLFNLADAFHVRVGTAS